MQDFYAVWKKREINKKLNKFNIKIVNYRAFKRYLF